MEERKKKVISGVLLEIPFKTHMMGVGGAEQGEKQSKVDDMGIQGLLCQ